MKKDANLTDIPDNVPVDSDVSSVLAAYKSEGDPDLYEYAYLELRRFVDESLDIYKVWQFNSCFVFFNALLKIVRLNLIILFFFCFEMAKSQHELAMILYPVFVHMYLELVYNDHEEQAKKLIDKFGAEQEHYYHEDITRLATVTKRDQMSGNDLAETFKSNEFIIRISRDTLSLLKRHLQEKKQSVIMNIVNEHLYFDLYEGVARNKAQCEATAGAMTGEAKRQDNKVKVYYGLLKEPDMQTLAQPQEEDDDLDPDAPDKPKKKKSKKDPLFSKKSKSDPNAPPIDRMPLPELRDIDKQEKVRSMREAMKRVPLGPDSLPSVCFYTILNSSNSVTCAEICDDTSLVAIGFADSMLRVWSLTPSKLREMKPADQLKEVDKDAGM